MNCVRYIVGRDAPMSVAAGHDRSQHRRGLVDRNGTKRLRGATDRCGRSLFGGDLSDIGDRGDRAAVSRVKVRAAELAERFPATSV